MVNRPVPLAVNVSLRQWSIKGPPGSNQGGTAKRKLSPLYGARAFFIFAVAGHHRPRQPKGKEVAAWKVTWES